MVEELVQWPRELATGALPDAAQAIDRLAQGGSEQWRPMLAMHRFGWRKDEACHAGTGQGTARNDIA